MTHGIMYKESEKLSTNMKLYIHNVIQEPPIKSIMLLKLEVSLIK